jgi:hypothetical protein
MIKTILWLILAVGLFLWTAKTTISFSPFKIVFEKLWTAIGIIVLCIGIGLLQYQQYKDGLEDGRKNTIDSLNEMLKAKSIEAGSTINAQPK